MSTKQIFALCLAAASFSASATLTPAYDTFGPLPQATFGGSGIPNTAVAISSLSNGDVTLGLTATSRYFNLPSVSNNNAGRFFATAGVDPTSSGSIASLLAQWNFDYYIGGTASALSQYTFVLAFDVDPSSSETFVNVPLAGAASQDSWNLGFDSFEAAGLYSFNPNANGEYSFKLQALNLAGTVVSTTSMVVQVGTVPEPTSLALVGLALAGAAGLSRRRKAS